MTQHNKSGATRTVEAWCCGIAADDELGNTNVTVYASKESCEKANQCAVNDPKWCAPRKLVITFDTNWIPADQLPAPVADAGVKRPTVTRKMLLNQPKYPAGRAEAYWTSLENKVSSLELQLTQAREEIAELKALAPRWREQAKGSTHWEGCYLDHRACAISRVSDLEVTLTQAHGKNVELAERVKELEAHLRKICNHGRYVRDTNKQEAALPASLMDEALAILNLSSAASGVEK